MAKHNEIKPLASHGDIVTVKGYDNRVFTVEEFTVEYLHHADKTITPSVIYDLTCPFSYDFIIAEQTDITVVCKADKAQAYVAQIEPYTPTAPQDYEMPAPIREWLGALNPITDEDLAKSKPKPKRLSMRQKQAVVDGLLDELIGVQTVVDMCGIDAEYAGMIADVKRRLGEATA